MNSLPLTHAAFHSDESNVTNVNLTLDFEPAHTEFNACRGHLAVSSPPSIKGEASVDGKLLLMRETSLRNTEFVYGLVVYTGAHTAIQMSSNSGEKSPVKQSHVQRYVVQRHIVVCFCFCFCCC
jgi:magnesium-transporting ATPase (P-type)